MNFKTIIAPSHIGPYMFKNTIGEGAFSVVKLAVDKQNEFYACKIVPKSSLNTDELKDRFEIEIRVNQQLHHSGIVQIIDLLRDEMNYYIFMEFCPNGELFNYIVERGRLEENEAKIIVLQLLKALDYVHSIGISHRDLKPENLLFDPYGRIKISDFGLSRFVGYHGLVDTPCGSPCYASPECLSGESYDGRKSDMWSLGVIIYAMVTGQLPWTKRNQAQLFVQIRSGEYTIPKFLSVECKELISKLMDVNPNTRVGAKEAMELPWLKDVEADADKFGNSNKQIVSIKKVDQFFSCDDNYLDIAYIKNISIERFPSQKPTDFKFVVNELKNGNKIRNLPPLVANDRKKMHFSQPISSMSVRKQFGYLNKSLVVPKINKIRVTNPLYS